MDLRALLENIGRANRIGRRPVDRLRYLIWTYGGHRAVRPFLPSDITLAVTYDDPIGNLNVTVRPNGGSDAFILSEVFNHRYYDLPLPTPPATILDLGANAGFTALFFARTWASASLACVEPMPENVRLLKKNLDQNNVCAYVFEVAALAEDGDVRMEHSPMDYGHKVAGSVEGDAHRYLTVPGLSIPTLMARLGWDRIGLLKVDIEGYESVLLRERCEWLRRVDAMCIEIHDSFSEDDLRVVGHEWGFSAPVQLPGIWLLLREGAGPNGRAE